MTTKIVYVGADDEFEFIVSQKIWNETTQTYDLIPIDFVTNGVTKIDVAFGDQLINSTDDPTMVRFADGGKLWLKLGSINTMVRGRVYAVVSRAYDPIHPLGQTIIAPTRLHSSLNLNFK